MSRGDPLTPDGDQADRLADLMADFDEGLRSGAAAPAGRDDPAPPDLRPRLDLARDCLRLLEEVWPRSGGGREAPSNPSASFRLPDSGQRFGRFEVVRQLGQGGGGTVYLAIDPSLGRPVALKLPRPEALLNPELRRRFYREARLAARLDHPNLVPVYEAGEVGPVCYITAMYCEGQTLCDWLRRRDRPDDPRAAAAVTATLAEAVHAAHRGGILHRDIKPSNILLVPRPDAPMMGRLLDRDFIPRLTDFGLARTMEDPGGETRTGAILGTPQYMAPEQAEARPEDLGPPTDVYALGVLLYEILTDRPPFRGDSDLGTLRLISREEPVPPRFLRPTIPRDLEAICLKCLEKQPRRRYDSAWSLAADLRRFLAGEPIRARPIGPAGQLGRWSRRNPSLAVSVAAVGILLAAAAVLSVAASFHFGRVAHREQALRDAESRARWALEQKLYFHQIARAQQEWRIDNPEGFDRELEACLPELRGWEWRYLRQRRPGALLTLRGHTGIVHGVAFSPRGDRLASASGDGTVRTWDPATGRALLTIRGHAPAVRCLAFDPEGRLLASAGDDGTIRVHDAAEGRQAGPELHQVGPVLALGFAPDGGRLASCGADRTVRLWDPSSGREVVALHGHAGVVTCLAFSPDGRALASADEAGQVRLWDAVAGRPTLTLPGHRGRVHGLTFGRDGRSLVTAGEDQVLRVWDLASGRELATIRGHAGLITGLAAGPGTRQIASASEDGSVKVWDPETEREILTFTGHTDAVRGVSFHPDGSRVASGGGDQSIRIWDIHGAQDALLLGGGHTAAINEVAVGPDGRRIASASRDGTVRVWDATTHREALVLRGHDGPVYGVAFHPDGRQVASAGGDRSVRLWDARSGREIRALRGHSGKVIRVAYSPDGRLLASTSHDATVRVWDLATGRESLTLGGRGIVHGALAFSPDGSSFATGGDDGDLRIWDPRNGRELRRLTGHAGSIRDVAFSPDGRRLASAGSDRTVRVWGAATGRPEVKLLGHAGFVTGVAFSPDGARIASTSWDGTARVWDAATGQQAIILDGREVRLRGVAFSPDGQQILAGSSDSTVRIWDAAPRGPADLRP